MKFYNASQFIIMNKNTTKAFRMLTRDIIEEGT